MRYFESYIWSLKITSNDFYSITHLPGKDQILHKKTLKLTNLHARLQGFPPVGFMHQGSDTNKDPFKPDKKKCNFVQLFIKWQEKYSSRHIAREHVEPK